MRVSKQRTMVFWVGLILFCLALVELFGIAWMVFWFPPPSEYLKGLVPPIVAGVIFTAIGIYMMRQGKKSLISFNSSSSREGNNR